MNPEIYILGSSSATPTRERHPSSQILKMDSAKIMIDCGEGTQSQLLKYGIRQTGIDYICISHLHGDHYFGLIGLISTMNLMGRQQNLSIIGPPELKIILDQQILYGQMTPKFEIIFYPTSTNGFNHVLETDKFEIFSFPLKHRIHCTGFLIKEKESPRTLLIDKAKEANIPVEFYKRIKAGEDFVQNDGTVIPNRELTTDPEAIKSYAYCSDTIYDPEIVPYISNCSMLYHESTYLKNLEDRATLYFHSTAEQAAKIAVMANAGKLIIGHFSSRYENLQPLLDEAREIFPNTELAIEGEKFSIENNVESFSNS